jgi:ABC-2 type transport system permease protein
VAVLTNVAAGALGLLVLVTIGGYAFGGSVLLMASVAAVGLAFAGLTVLTVQLTEYSRAAAGMSGGFLGGAFLVRAAGDMAQEGGSALSWFSPLAWGQQTAPFVLDRWWPLLLLVAFAVATTAVGFALAERRDHGAGLLSTRPGRPRAHPRLGTPLGLTARLQRASILGWGLSLVAGGLLYGAYADALRGAIDDMPEVFVELFGAEDLLAGYLGYMAVFMAYLAAGYAIMTMQSLRSEETVGRGEPLLATPLSRSEWLGTTLVVAAAAVVGIMVATGAATGIGAAIVTGQGSLIADLTLAHLNQVAPVLVVLGVAALSFGLAPRLLPAVWALPAYGMLVGTFGQLLDLPSLAHALSPFEHPADMPLEPFRVMPTAVLLAVAGATAVGGVAAFRRREIDAT